MCKKNNTKKTIIPVKRTESRAMITRQYRLAVENTREDINHVKEYGLMSCM